MLFHIESVPRKYTESEFSVTTEEPTARAPNSGLNGFDSIGCPTCIQTPKLSWYCHTPVPTVAYNLSPALTRAAIPRVELVLMRDGTSNPVQIAPSSRE